MAHHVRRPDRLTYVAGLGRPGADAQPLARALGVSDVLAFGCEDPIVSDLAAAADRLVAPGTQSLVIAHSMGAFAAECACYRYPDRVAGLVLLDPSLARTRGDGLPPAVHRAIGTMLGGSRVTRALRENLHYREFSRLTAAARVRYRLQVPTLLITAARSERSWWYREHAAMAMRLDASHAFIPRASHLLATQHSAAVAALIEGWRLSLP